MVSTRQNPAECFRGALHIPGDARRLFALRTRAGSRGTAPSKPELVRSSGVHEEGLSRPLQRVCKQTLRCSAQGKAKRAAGTAITTPLPADVIPHALKTLQLASPGGH